MSRLLTLTRHNPLLYYVCMRARITNAKIARMTGKTIYWASRIRNGTRIPTATGMMALENAYGWDIRDQIYTAHGLNLDQHLPDDYRQKLEMKLQEWIDQQ